LQKRSVPGRAFNPSAKKLVTPTALPNDRPVTLLAKLLLALGAGLIILALV